MQIHHNATVTPAGRPVRLNRRGSPPFAVVPLDDHTTIELHSAGEARWMVAQFAMAAEFLDSVEPPAAEEPPPLLRVVQDAPGCARCKSTEFVVPNGDQWRCWNTELCAERAEALHAQEADAHDPVTCRNGDHYGQCSGATPQAVQS